MQTLERTPDVDYASLSSGIDIRRIATESVANAEEMVAVVVADLLREATEAMDALQSVSASADAVRHTIAERDEMIEEARRQRGEAAVDGTDTATFDKRLATLRSERELAQDQLTAILPRIAAAERDSNVARWHAGRELTNAINGCVEKAKADAANLKGRLDVALTTLDLLKPKALFYLNAQESAYKRILDHKTKFPHLYFSEG